MSTGTSTWTASNGILYGNESQNRAGFYHSFNLSGNGDKIAYGEYGFEIYKGKVTVLSLSSSPTYRLEFLHIPKNAGTMIESIALENNITWGT